LCAPALTYYIILARNTNRMGRFSTIDLLIKLA
jgi:hypothetical protein